jgi:hypothetical protein
MKNLQSKIKELLDKSSINCTSWDEIKSKFEMQDKLTDELEVLAKQNKTILGRIVRFPMEDSYAVYIITKINIRTVVLTWIDYMDGWVDDRCGKKCNININYANNYITSQDNIRKQYFN